MSLDYYSEIFKRLLLRNVVIKCGTKTCRAGKIQNFDIKQFYVKFFIENNKNNVKVLELPYPYKVHHTESKTTLNYQTSSFCNKSVTASLKIKTLNSKGSSRFFNNDIEIIVVD